MRYVIYLLFIGTWLTGCRHIPVHNQPPAKVEAKFLTGYESLSPSEKILADSILEIALDNEALYTLMGDLKPVSSIGFSMSYPIAKDSLQAQGQHSIVSTEVDSIKQFITELKTWNRVLQVLSFDQYEFLLIPFRAAWKGDRNFQILVCRKDLLNQMLLEKETFFAQWGFVPGTDPAILLTAIEFEEKYDRYRAYGYLFGYPKHAVDFFVEASQEHDASGNFVQRQFFNIPVHSMTKGRFTYALPEEMEPTPIDSQLYHQSVQILDEYRTIRPHFVKPDGKLKSVALLRHWHQNLAPNTGNQDFK